jgi:hypothetical protein
MHMLIGWLSGWIATNRLKMMVKLNKITVVVPGQDIIILLVSDSQILAVQKYVADREVDGWYIASIKQEV